MRRERYTFFEGLGDRAMAEGAPGVASALYNKAHSRFQRSIFPLGNLRRLEIRDRLLDKADESLSAAFKAALRTHR